LSHSLRQQAKKRAVSTSPVKRGRLERLNTSGQATIKTQMRAINSNYKR